MSLMFNDEFVSLGTFHDEAEQLAEKAYTTETFHYRVIVNLNEPFRTAVSMILVKNQLGACLPYEVGDTKKALEEFHKDFLVDLNGGMTTTSAFYALARADRILNTDHPEVRWCINPSLLDDVYVRFDDYNFFLIPLKESGFLSSSRIYLSTQRNTLLADVPPMTYEDHPITKKFFGEKSQINGCKTPSICMIVPPAEQADDILPSVYIHGTRIPENGYFPILYGVKPSTFEEHKFICYFSYRKYENPNADLADRIIDRFGLRHLVPDCDSLVTWQDVSSAVNFYLEGYEAGRSAVLRANKADELAE